MNRVVYDTNSVCFLELCSFLHLTSKLSRVNVNSVSAEKSLPSFTNNKTVCPLISPITICFSYKYVIEKHVYQLRIDSANYEL